MPSINSVHVQRLGDLMEETGEALCLLQHTNTVDRLGKPVYRLSFVTRPGLSGHAEAGNACSIFGEGNRNVWFFESSLYSVNLKTTPFIHEIPIERFRCVIVRRDPNASDKKVNMIAKFDDDNDERNAVDGFAYVFDKLDDVPHLNARTEVHAGAKGNVPCSLIFTVASQRIVFDACDATQNEWLILDEAAEAAGEFGMDMSNYLENPEGWNDDTNDDDS